MKVYSFQPNTVYQESFLRSHSQNSALHDIMHDSCVNRTVIKNPIYYTEFSSSDRTVCIYLKTSEK